MEFASPPMNARVIVGSLFLAFGLTALAFGGREAWRAHASVDWPTVPGEVTTAKLVKRHSRQPKVPWIEYRYAVAGAQHKSHRWFFGDHHGAAWTFTDCERWI